MGLLLIIAAIKIGLLGYLALTSIKMLHVSGLLMHALFALNVVLNTIGLVLHNQAINQLAAAFALPIICLMVIARLSIIRQTKWTDDNSKRKWRL